MRISRSHQVLLLVLFVLVIDQALKIWVKTNMYYGEEFYIFGLPWARIKFIENPGMAFGMTFGGDTGKLLLSLFRIVAIGLLIYLIRQLLRQNVAKGLIYCFSLILAGAIGNMIDSAIYGLIFEASDSMHKATLLGSRGGYAPLLHGRVVDMFYFPMIDTYWPSWMPWVGGDRFTFFNPIFNIADSAISVGVVWMLLFHRHFFFAKEEEKVVQKQKEPVDQTSSS